MYLRKALKLFNSMTYLKRTQIAMTFTGNLFLMTFNDYRNIANSSDMDFG